MTVKQKIAKVLSDAGYAVYTTIPVCLTPSLFPQFRQSVYLLEPDIDQDKHRVLIITPKEVEEWVTKVPTEQNDWYCSRSGGYRTPEEMLELVADLMTVSTGCW